MPAWWEVEPFDKNEAVLSVHPQFAVEIAPRPKHASVRRYKSAWPCFREPRVRIAWAPEELLATDPYGAVEHCVANGFSMIMLNSTNQTREIVEPAHRLGIEARSSGILSREKMIAAAELGCNGMTINWPDWLLQYVKERCFAIVPSAPTRECGGASHSSDLNCTQDHQCDGMVG